MLFLGLLHFVQIIFDKWIFSIRQLSLICNCSGIYGPGIGFCLYDSTKLTNAAQFIAAMKFCVNAWCSKFNGSDFFFIFVRLFFAKQKSIYSNIICFICIVLSRFIATEVNTKRHAFQTSVLFKLSISHTHIRYRCNLNRNLPSEKVFKEVDLG